MPIHEVDGGYKWGSHGHVYSSRAGAERQAAAAYAHGYKGDAAKDMSRGQFASLLSGLLQFFTEEAREPEHQAADAALNAAGVAVRAPSGKLLFLKRKDGQGWAFPGGVAEGDEEPHQTALRELLEETGYGGDRELSPLHAHSLNGVDFATFLHEAPDEFVPKLNDEHSEFAWARPSKAPQPLHPGVASLLSNVAARDAASFESIRDAVKGKAEDPDALAAWIKRKVSPGWSAAEDKALDASHEAIGERIAREINRGHSPKQAAAIAYSELGEAHDGAFGLAMDRESTREKDKDGRLHVAENNISKATVNEYLGREIPKWEQLGLEPTRRYRLLRHPDELAKAAPTFNNLPILSRHVEPLNAVDSHPELVIGSLGTDAEFRLPYLKNSIVLWTQPAVDAAESDQQSELSSAYYYRADMTPGVYEGHPYDGVMRDIVGNHVALVPKGRAGSDVAVGDAALEENTDMPTKPVVLTRKATATLGALVGYLRPKLAKDVKIGPDGINFYPVLADVTAANFGAKKPKIAEELKKQLTGRLAPSVALDATMSDVSGMLDGIEREEVPEGADLDPNSGLPMGAEELRKRAGDAEPHPLHGFLKDKLSPENHAAAMKMLEEHGAHDEETEEEKRKREEEERRAKDAGGEFSESPELKGARDAYRARTGKDAPPDFKGVPKVGEGPVVTKGAMDAALEEQRKKMLADQRAVQEAREDVRPWVGAVAMAHDTAEAVYRTALGAMGLGEQIKDVRELPALRAVLHAQPKPGARRDAEPATAMDAAASEDFAKRFPGAARILTL